MIKHILKNKNNKNENFDGIKQMNETFKTTKI